MSRQASSYDKEDGSEFQMRLGKSCPGSQVGVRITARFCWEKATAQLVVWRTSPLHQWNSVDCSIWSRVRPPHPERSGRTRCLPPL